MELSWLLIGSCIALLVIFDFTNGFNDATDKIAYVKKKAGSENSVI
jgi:hypothetical protein